MILAIDIGNTNLKIGVFNDKKLIASWRLSTKSTRTSDEYGMVLYDLLSQENLSFKDIESCIVASVAPTLNYTIEHMCKYYMGQKPMMVSSNINLGMQIDYKTASTLGADRIICALAAYKEYSSTLVKQQHLIYLIQVELSWGEQSHQELRHRLNL